MKTVFAKRMLRVIKVGIDKGRGQGPSAQGHLRPGGRQWSCRALTSAPRAPSSVASPPHQLPSLPGSAPPVRSYWTLIPGAQHPVLLCHAGSSCRGPGHPCRGEGGPAEAPSHLSEVGTHSGPRVLQLYRVLKKRQDPQFALHSVFISHEMREGERE